MLELMKKPRTDGMVELCAIVPESKADHVMRLLEDLLAPAVPAEEVFPDSTPGRRLRGARGIREMTQKQLAAAVGCTVSNISDMEHNRRAISKDMARKLAAALDFDYRVFL